MKDILEFGSVMLIATLVASVILATVIIAPSFCKATPDKDKIERELMEDWARRGYGEFRMNKWNGESEFHHYDARYDLKP